VRRAGQPLTDLCLDFVSPVEMQQHDSSVNDTEDRDGLAQLISLAGSAGA
jgi:hypothetical protein